MRRVLSLLLLPALALPALSLAARADEPPKLEAAPSRHTRMNWEERFARANLAGDGHLTLEEAKAGFPMVAKHFVNIDVDGKGYVTVKDLRTWYAMRKVARDLRALPDDTPTPRNPYDRGSPDRRPVGIPAATQVRVSAEQ